jgi:hypothetical protein
MCTPGCPFHGKRFPTNRPRRTLPTSTTRVLRSQTNAAQATPTKVTKPKPKARRRRLDPWAPKRKVNPNPNPKPRPPPRTHFTCRICIEEYTADQFPKWFSFKRGIRESLEVPSDCMAHLARNPRRRKTDPVCKGCIGNTMAARLDTLGARQVGVGCVEPGCETPWTWELIMRYMPGGAAMEKFNMDMFEVWKQESTPNMVTCISPGCGAVGLPDMSAPGYPQIACGSCALRQCAECLVPWHADLTCTERKAQHVNEKMSAPEKETLELMQAKDAKRCPNCQLVIEKDGGCNSMLCIGCQKYFNWATAGKKPRSMNGRVIISNTIRTASAVLGAKKAEPFTHIDPYMHHSGPVVCELDALQGATTAPVVAAAA